MGPLTPEVLRARVAEVRAAIAAQVAPADQALAATAAALAASTTPEEQSAAWAHAQLAERAADRATRAALDARLVEVYALVLEGCRQLQGVTVDVLGEPQVWQLQPYDVQLVGAIALHEGRIAEMATGEGKTLVAAFPLVLGALAGEGVHLVTANSYLAQRDSVWMGALYQHLGLTVGCVDGTEPVSPERVGAYAADITYGTTHELGFDYLRDNMAPTRAGQVQRGHAYAIVDEIDAVLIDDARTPLIISGPSGQETVPLYHGAAPAIRSLVGAQHARVDALITTALEDRATGDSFAAGRAFLAARRGLPDHPRLLGLVADDPTIEQLIQDTRTLLVSRKRLGEIDEALYYVVEPEDKAVFLTDMGMHRLIPDDATAFVLQSVGDQIAALEDDPTLDEREREEARARVLDAATRRELLMNAIHQMLKAYTLFHRDRDYIVTDRGVEIVDTGTGRTMDGRRWSNGLHLAVEVKEGVETVGETQPYATITVQHYFRRYARLAGMTGTASSAAGEFGAIYGLSVLVIPTHRPLLRDDRWDVLVRTQAQKEAALVSEIQRLHALQLPVLVGTESVSASERLSALLDAVQIPHALLNAKQHHAEAGLVARAGQPGAVTIATNMAGRGTDIVLDDRCRAPRTVAWCHANGVDLDTLPDTFDAARSLDGRSTLSAETVVECGGLHVLGAARNTSLRVDRQLRGRAGRQGDPGASQYFVSIEDALLRDFGSERILSMLGAIGMVAQGGMSSKWISMMIDTAQKALEQGEAAARQQMVDYDTPIDVQRGLIYGVRDVALDAGPAVRREVERTLETVLRAECATHLGEYFDPDRVARLLRRLTDLGLVTALQVDSDEPTTDDITSAVVSAVTTAGAAWRTTLGETEADARLAHLYLITVDEVWREHLRAVTRLKEAISYRGVGQTDPVRAYVEESYALFDDAMVDLRLALLARYLRQVMPSDNSDGQAGADGHGVDANVDAGAQTPGSHDA
jgi:preprotein translocase subunit SecA